MERARDVPAEYAAESRSLAGTGRRAVALPPGGIVDPCEQGARHGRERSLLYPCRSMPEVLTEAALTCPECGHRSVETMPTNACQHFYRCQACDAMLRPLPGDCCVFCSYADTPCSPIQLSGERN